MAGIPLRILHLVHQFTPDYLGGTELYTETLARYQVDMGHSVSILSPSHNENDGAPNAVDEVVGRVYRVPVGERSRIRVFKDAFVHQGLTHALTRILHAERPQVVHIQHLMGMPAHSINQVRDAGIAYVVTLHDYWYGCANAQLITNHDATNCNGPSRWYINCGRCALARAGKPGLQWLAPTVAPLMAARNKMLRSILQHAARVIAPTEFVRQTYVEMGSPTDNMIVVPHGIELPDDPGSEFLHRQRPTDANHIHIGYIGSLAWQKGVHVLIAAVNQLPHESVHLSICGDVNTNLEYVNRLRESVQHPGIRFVGRISRSDLWQTLSSFDVLVLPTLWYEASPLTIQEAFAVRVPLVASRIGAMQEKIRDGIDGILFSPGDVDALRETLHLLLTEPERLSQLRSGICPVRTMADHAREINSIYQELA
ncbi:MAG: glycosyltransferase family 4 protein [Anaerolineae bacterium]